VPAMIAWTWLAILAGGVATLVARNLGESRGPEPIMVVALAAVLLAPTVADVPVRLAAIDRSRDVSARVWVERTLPAMDQGAVIVSWWSYSTPLWYAQLVEGRRTDIRIIDDRTRLDENLGGVTDVIDANLRIHPVYVIRVDQTEIDSLVSRYDLEYLDGPTAAGLTRVLGRRAGS
jgi:hypothetical protein